MIKLKSFNFYVGEISIVALYVNELIYELG